MSADFSNERRNPGWLGASLTRSTSGFVGERLDLFLRRAGASGGTTIAPHTVYGSFFIHGVGASMIPAAA